jgi:hypothetical protein
MPGSDAPGGGVSIRVDIWLGVDTGGDWERVRQVRTNRPAGCWLAVARHRWLAVAVGGAALLSMAACSPGTSNSGTGSTCGTTRTGVNVPVVIKVTKGTVDCATAMHVEQSYAAMIKDNQVQGNGGGAPVTVDGWTCQGYPTPQVLRTGDASECHSGSSEVVAVLALSSTGG